MSNTTDVARSNQSGTSTLSALGLIRWTSSNARILAWSQLCSASRYFATSGSSFSGIWGGGSGSLSGCGPGEGTVFALGVSVAMGGREGGFGNLGCSGSGYPFLSLGMGISVFFAGKVLAAYAGEVLVLMPSTAFLSANHCS